MFKFMKIIIFSSEFCHAMCHGVWMSSSSRRYTEAAGAVAAVDGEVATTGERVVSE